MPQNIDRRVSLSRRFAFLSLLAIAACGSAQESASGPAPELDASTRQPLPDGGGGDIADAQVIDSQVDRLSSSAWKLVVRADGVALTQNQIRSNLATNAGIQSALTGGIVQIPFAALYLECSPFAPTTGDKPFECVAINATPAFNGAANSAAFDTHFVGVPHDQTIVSFENLGKDAILVVPKPIAANAVYYHLKSFLNGAPAAQTAELWATTGRDLDAQLAKGKTIWLSTHGTGVPWLHVRLDTTPKYYSYAPFKTAN